MVEVEGARSFRVDGDSYDSFMGRYSRPLAIRFADAAGVVPGGSALDVGCGPGALTGVLVDGLGADAVAACDPSETFVAACSERLPGVVVRSARAEALPFDDHCFDHTLAQLVLHFVSDADQAVAEMCRVTRSGGVVGACVWDFDGGMQMLRQFWGASLAVDPAAPDEARTMRFGRAGELLDLFRPAGLVDVAETTLDVESTYSGFEELWSGYLAGVGPAGTYCLSLPSAQRDQVRAELFRRLGSPTGPITLGAVARCAIGRVA